MLLKINAVEEIGRFAKLTHRAEQLSRLSLIFARNGYGKSTLCAILRSAADGLAEPLQARRRVGAVGETRVQSTWASGATIAFGGGKWNGSPGKVHIFDQEFVLKNLHVGESVTRENKRSLLPVVLGDRGVELARNIRVLDQEQKTLTGELARHADVICARCPAVPESGVSAYCQRVVPDDLEVRIAGASRNVHLATQAAAVRQRPNPSVIDIAPLLGVEALAARTLDSVAGDVAATVEAHIARHALEPSAGRWLRYGLERVVDDTCPFCNQPVAANDLIGAYRVYFSAAFAAMSAEIDVAAAALRALVDGNLDATLKRNAADLAFWSTVADLPDLPALDDDARRAVDATLACLAEVLAAKRANPLAAASWPTDQTVTAGLARLQVYNEGVAACAAAIERARALLAESSLGEMQDTLRRWQALGERSAEPVRGAVHAYLAAEARLAEIKNEKVAAQSALTSYTTTTMATRQTEVNALLSDFGVGFKISDTKTTYVGREPNTEFAIELPAGKVKVGERSAREPSFSTVLSAGDKTTLALAFFLSQVRADPGLANAVVVFDDPFHSQDLNRQFETTSQIRLIAGRAGQTLVLSHDPRFLRQIEKDAVDPAASTFQLLCADTGEGALTAWSTADELKALYVRQSEMIREYASHGSLLRDVTTLGLHQAIRPFLEDYLRARFPGRFADGDMLNGMILAIEAAGADDPLAASVADLYSLNEYTRPNMHGGAEASDPTALRAQCRKVVRIVGAY